MKNLLFAIGILTLCSVTVAPILLSSRSNQQVVIHSENMNKLTSSINTYFSKGYRVVFMSSQSVATSIQTANNTRDQYDGSKRDLFGEIIVVMEK